MATDIQVIQKELIGKKVRLSRRGNKKLLGFIPLGKGTVPWDEALEIARIKDITILSNEKDLVNLSMKIPGFEKKNLCGSGQQKITCTCGYTSEHGTVHKLVAVFLYEITGIFFKETQILAVTVLEIPAP